MSGILVKKQARFKKKHIFIICMLAYPVLHFLTMWIFINFDSVLLTFKRFDLLSGEYKWVGVENYKILFDGLKNNPVESKRIWNSISYLFINILIITPLCLMIAYFIYKKIPGGRTFRIIYYLPSVMPMVALVLAFLMSIDGKYGIVNEIIKGLGGSAPNWLSGNKTGVIYSIVKAFGVQPPDWLGYSWAQLTIWIFCVWSGIGYGVILFTSAMGRIPKEIIEYGKLEGLGYTKEFFKVIMPLIWPTFTTLFVFGLMAPFSVYMQPLFLTNGAEGTSTISLEIFFITRANSDLQTAATLGLAFSIVGAPIVLIVRRFMETRYADVDF